MLLRVNIQHLRTFHAVAIERNISQAARRLNVSQSTLSKQLKALEDRHKLALFRNRTPPLQFTPAGEALYERAKVLFAAVEQIDALLDEDMTDERLVVRLGSDTPPLAARLACELKQAFPNLRASARIENARDSFDLLRSGQVDIAIVNDPPAHSQFYYAPVYEDVLMAALPDGHRLAGDDAFPIEAIEQETLLLREAMSRTREATERYLLGFGLAAADTVELHTRETIREAIALGLGISFFYAGECPPDARLAYRPIRASAPPPRITAYFVCLNERRTHPLVRRAERLARAWKGD